MSYRGKRPGGGLETEIEKAREEGLNFELSPFLSWSFYIPMEGGDSFFCQFYPGDFSGNWRRVIELANQLKERPDTVKQFETLGWFLIGGFLIYGDQILL